MFKKPEKIEFLKQLIRGEIDKIGQEMAVSSIEDEVRTFWGLLIDSGFSQYEVEWQRIGNMQQSAGILVGALAIVFSAILFFLTIVKSNGISKDIINYYNIVIIPLISLISVYTIISLVYLFLLIYPKNIVALKRPKELLTMFNNGDLAVKLRAMIDYLDIPLVSLHNHVEKKQYYYRKCLISCIISFSITAIAVFLIIGEMLCFISYSNYFYFAYLLFIIISIYLIFIKKGVRNEPA